jgi:hypothetical protein
MTTSYNPMTSLPAAAGYKTGDVLVLVGELFGRGYANGIVDEAKKAGLTVIGTTVGRRDSDGTLRPLTAEELAEAEANLGGKIINIPLEAGFDMEPGSDGQTPLDLLKSVKPDGWDAARFDFASIEESRRKGTIRFTSHLAVVVSQLQQLIPAGATVLFAHAMAGGIPRARVFMPLLNRVFKGQGDKYLASGDFWGSDLGRLCQLSFDEVTADTFRYLIDATAAVRSTHDTRYVAYGYHGCAVLIDGTYTWQSYTPYLQGWAKMRLEEHAAAAWQQGVRATVYNCPEIQTNSSALFMGVEISLYPLLEALAREGDGPVAAALRAECQALLAEGATLERLLAGANAFLKAPLQAEFRDLAAWPHHNTREQMEAMLTCSAELLALNANPKEIVCAPLSRAVFRAVGYLMFNDSWAPTAPVAWLNHEIIARALLD